MLYINISSPPSVLSSHSIKVPNACGKIALRVAEEICNKIDPEKEINWIQELDKNAKMVYNIENEFGPNRFLYSYQNGEIQFDNIMMLTTLPPTSKQPFEDAIITKGDLQLLEKVQNAIEKQIAEHGVCGKSCMNMCYISDFYNKVSEKIEEIEKVMEDRNMGIDL